MGWAEETEDALRIDGHIGNAPSNDELFDDALEKYLPEVSSKKAKSTHLSASQRSPEIQQHSQRRSQSCIRDNIAQYPLFNLV